MSRPAIVWSVLAGEIEDISIDATAAAASAAGKLDEKKIISAPQQQKNVRTKVKQNIKHASEETRKKTQQTEKKLIKLTN